MGTDYPDYCMPRLTNPLTSKYQGKEYLKKKSYLKNANTGLSNRSHAQFSELHNFVINTPKEWGCSLSALTQVLGCSSIKVWD